jgi:hypothetical protein
MSPEEITMILQPRMVATVLILAGSCLIVRGEGAETAPPAAWTIGRPIVTYWAGPEMTEVTARQMAQGGWNVVWCREQDLDVAQRNGLRAMLFAPDLITPAALDDPEKCRQLDGLIARVARHPALYCYFLLDEPGAGAFPAIGRLVAYLRARDPAHMAYINLFPTYASNEQLGTVGDTVTAYREHLRQFVTTVKPELISYDHYQFATDGDLDGYFLNLALVRETARQARLPFLNIVQACSWTPVRRVPQGNEMRYLVYTTLAYGAQGISYYVYCHPGHTGGIANPDGSPTALYHALQPLNQEFVAIASQLQPLQSLGVYHQGMLPAGAVALPDSSPIQLDPAIAVQQYKPPERLRGVLLGLFGSSEDKPATDALVVNLDYQQALQITLRAAGPVRVFDATTQNWAEPAERRVRVDLPPGGGKLLRWRP